MYIYIYYVYLYIISIPRIHKDYIYINNKSQLTPWWWDIPIPSLSQVCSIFFDRSWHSSSAALGGVEAVLFDPQGCRGPPLGPWKICDEWNGDEWWWMEIVCVEHIEVSMSHSAKSWAGRCLTMGRCWSSMVWKKTGWETPMEAILEVSDLGFNFWDETYSWNIFHIDPYCHPPKDRTWIR